MKLVLLAFSSALIAGAQPLTVKLDPAATKVAFTLSDVLHTVHGTFKLTKGELWFDPSSGNSDGLLIVAAATGDSGSHARDSRMEKNVLQAGRYPDITFTPDRIDGKVNCPGDSDFGLHGLFAIHGATHELTMRVKSHIQNDQLAATAVFGVPYVQWGMKNPSTLFLRVNETVQIDVETAGRVNPAAAK